MPTDGSITHWIGQLQAGDAEAVQPLWERYFHRLVGLARSKLKSSPRRMADEEDVALSAFDSFCRGAEHGQFPKLHDRDNLWQLLVVITARKAIDLVRFEQRQKRGGGAAVELPIGDPATPSSGDEPSVEQIVSREPTPEFAAQVAEQCERLLDRLNDASLRSVAIMKMEGYTNQEIAARLACAHRAVERKLQVIRSIWSHEQTAEH